MTGVVGGSKFSRIYHTRESRQRELDGWSLEEAHEYFRPSAGPYEDSSVDSVFDKIHDWGREHGGWTSHKALKELREHTVYTLSDEQRDEIVRDVNLTLERELAVKKTTLKKTGQVVYRDSRSGRFRRLFPMTRKEQDTIDRLERESESARVAQSSTRGSPKK
ncbi:MAG TPA: hypothetical protein VGS11_11875 [Candidatus Bathyarchaeia archaeon]|nr:hypothetical protein [Candidatus Bathyarchaeia archaeon]